MSYLNSPEDFVYPSLCPCLQISSLAVRNHTHTHLLSLPKTGAASEPASSGHPTAHTASLTSSYPTDESLVQPHLFTGL